MRCPFLQKIVLNSTAIEHVLCNFHLRFDPLSSMRCYNDYIHTLSLNIKWNYNIL